MDKILLFIPCYNCEKQITRVLDSIKKYSEFFNEVLIVDNISSDTTLETAIQWGKTHFDVPLKVFKNKNNYNLGGSHKVAFDYAIKNKYDYVIVLHGDNQGNISDIENILKSKSYRDYDCCLGARFIRGAKLINYSKIRIIGNIAFNILFSICLFKKIYDLGAGLNIYSVKSLKDKYYEKFPDALTFNYVMVFALDYYKQHYCFFPIHWSEDGQISNVKVTSQAIDLFTKLLRYLSNKNKFIHSDLRANIISEYKSDCIFSNKNNE